MVQEEYRFDEPQQPSKSKFAGIGKFIWNSDTKEFCGRDGASWGKVSLFYAVFYACLGGFFVGMLAVFVAVMPKDKPTYYGTSSTMNARKLNPGLGFRPQIDVEDSLIRINPKTYESDTEGHKQYIKNLQIFLDAKYKPQEKDVIDCVGDKDYTNELTNGKACRFDHNKIFKDTNCRAEKKFGYETNQPCVLIKLNKIISWLPEPSKNDSILIKCKGETSADEDNLIGVTYHSEDHLNDNEYGYIHKKYYPFFAQESYRAPFIWAQFNIASNTLVNIECKAIANNIDSDDRLNRRGQTKFTLFIAS